MKIEILDINTLCSLYKEYKAKKKYRVDFTYTVDGNEYQSHFHSPTFPKTNKGCQRMVRARSSDYPNSYPYIGTVIGFCFSPVSYQDKNYTTNRKGS